MPEAQREILQMLQPPTTGLPVKDFETRVTRLTEYLVALQGNGSDPRRSMGSIAGVADRGPDAVSTLRAVEEIEADLQNLLSFQMENGYLQKAVSVRWLFSRRAQY